MLIAIANPAELTPARLIVLVGLAAIGLLMWFAGARSLRPALAALGLVLGVGVGWSLATTMAPIEAGGWMPAPWVAAALMGLFLACLGALLYRIAIAMTLSVMLGLLGPAIVLVVHETGLVDKAPIIGSADEARPGTVFARPALPPEEDPATDWLFPETAQELRNKSEDGELPPGLTALDLAARVGLDDEQRARLMEAREQAETLAQTGRERWERTPERLRPLLVATGIVGFFLGLVLGTLTQQLSAILVTSLFGAGLWLVCLSEVLGALGTSVDTLLPPGPAPIASAWLVTAVAGVVIQWTFRPKTADRSR